MSDFMRHNAGVCSFSTADSWVILSPIEQSIKRKIEAVGVPLKDWDIQINYGIKTGYNEAFIITTEKRNDILNACADEDERKRTEELIRPILRGRDIKRYSYDWAGLWLIYLPWHFPLQFDETITGASPKAELAFQSSYPAVYAHMLQYKEPLSKRNKAETGIRYEWYALQRWGANYWDDFSKPKIVYQELCRKGTSFALDLNGYFLGNTGYILTAPTLTQEELSTLCSFLNSPVALYQLDKISTKFDETGWRWLRQFMAYIRIPRCLSQNKDWRNAFGFSNAEKEYIVDKYSHILV